MADYVNVGFGVILILLRVAVASRVHLSKLRLQLKRKRGIGACLDEAHALIRFQLNLCHVAGSIVTSLTLHSHGLL